MFLGSPVVTHKQSAKLSVLSIEGLHADLFVPPAAYQPSPAERRPSYPRPSNPNPHRQLSDRELVEQMPLLKLRTGARLGGEAFSDDAYKAGSAQKDVDRGGRARPQSNLRKPAAGQRPVAAPLSRVSTLML